MNSLVAAARPEHGEAQTGNGGSVFAGRNAALNGSTVSNNLAARRQRRRHSLPASSIVINSSVTFNAAAANGGGIDDASSDATVTLNNSHVDDNLSAFGLALTGSPINNGGSGYSVGEILTVNTPDDIVPALLEVTSTSAYGGTITGITELRREFTRSR